MSATTPRSAIIALILSLFAVPFARAADVTEGMLRAIGPDEKDLGPCPLEHTDVHVRITGFVARVDVTQKFHNPFDHKIEAVYVFPLSQTAAVDDMTMTIGDRVVRGVIKPREEAREIYEAARATGHVASLLDQERPNIFTQSVANIEPGERVEIRISYVENIDWADGTCHFDFPTVVGPRYIPGGGSAPAPMTTGTPTPQVPDADRITPPVVPEGMRAGHDLSITVEIAAGFPIQNLKSLSHPVDIEYTDAIPSEAVVTLKNESTIPNKDFVLTYETVTHDIGDTLLTHWDDRGGFFTLILQPPDRVEPDWIVPKEMIFVIDKSGSMNGFPIDTAKATMKRCIQNLNPDDTFNLMTFAGGVGFCFDKAMANTEANVSHALGYLQNLQGGGGTEMMNAILACLGGDQDPDRVRIVCFMTDGYVGNDSAIIDAVRRNAGETRVFAFGIGRSVNRYLLDGIARAGRGEVEYVLSPEQSEEASNRFYDRVTTPVLTDIEIDWGGLPVDEVYPNLIPDLFSAKPVVLKARYTAPAAGTIRLAGRRGSERFEREIVVNLPTTLGRNEVIASLWARAKVEDLMDRLGPAPSYPGDSTGGQPDSAVKNAIVDLALKYRLLTQFTSFVAVEELTITRGGEPTKVQVPVEMPEGVSYDGVFGKKEGISYLSAVRGMRRAPAASAPKAKLLVGRATGRAPEVRYERDAADASHDREAGPPATPEELRKRMLQAKLASVLHGLAEKVGDKKEYSDGRIKVTDGRVDVTVFLTDTSDETMKKLKEAGLEILVKSKAAYLVIGRIEVTKLEDLALLDVVRRVGGI